MVVVIMIMRMSVRMTMAVTGTMGNRIGMQRVMRVIMIVCLGFRR